MAGGIRSHRPANRALAGGKNQHLDVFDPHSGKEYPLALRTICEFFGTAILTIAVCGVTLGKDFGGEITYRSWGILVIGFIYMLLTYTLGGISGAQMNPAITLVSTIAGRQSWVSCLCYIVAQLVAGVAAAFIGTMAWFKKSGYYGKSADKERVVSFAVVPSNLLVDAHDEWWKVLAVEMVFALMLGFVYLNCFCTEKTRGNLYYGLAMALSILAGEYAFSDAYKVHISIFNGAVTVGMNAAAACMVDDISDDKKDIRGQPSTGALGWGFAWLGIHIVGMLLALLLFKGVRGKVSELCGRRGSSKVSPVLPFKGNGGATIATGNSTDLVGTLIAEFMGTFMFVFTAGLNIITHTWISGYYLHEVGQTMHISMFSALLAMMLALSNSSGAHFNPIVSLGLCLFKKPDGSGAAFPTLGGFIVFLQYLVGQCCAVFCAVLAYSIIAPAKWGGEKIDFFENEGITSSIWEKSPLLVSLCLLWPFMRVYN